MNYRLLITGVFLPEYSYISKWVKKLAHPRTLLRTSAKITFINAVQPFYGCQRNVCKNITVTVSVRVSVTVRVSSVWLVNGNSLVTWHLNSIWHRRLQDCQTSCI